MKTVQSSHQNAAKKLVELSRSLPIDDRAPENNLAEILKDYAEEAKSKDRDKINGAIIKLFQRKIVSGSPGTSAGDRSAVRNFKATPQDIYDGLLRTANQQPQDHAQGISSLAFAFASILDLSLPRGGISQSDSGYNKSCFDLSPLYGANETETNCIRKKDGRGMLEPDSFTEERLDLLPDSVPALLVLWNRYHNYVAKQLLWHNDGDKWNDPANLTPEQCARQDKEIFDVARSITCIHFMNVVKEDFVKGLIGMPMAGPSAHVDILHGVRGETNREETFLSSEESYFLYSFSPFAPLSLARNYDKLRRNEHGRFEDNDLAKLLFDAIEAKAGSPGGGRVPDWSREQEILRLEQARQVKVCTLNEFRQHLGLKPLKSFKEWNPELAKMASDLYDSEIDNLELYPGLLCERSSGAGFGFGYTMSWGLIADIISRIRCDPMFTSEFKASALTKWGYKDCISSIGDVKESNLCFYNTGGSLGGLLPKLLQRTLPHNCAYDNIYCLFPFVVPEESKKYMKELSEPHQGKYTTERPKEAKIKVLRTLKAISEALNDPMTFSSPYKHNLMELTGGYGHFLGFDDLALHDYDLMLTLFSLMPDRGAAERIGSDFAQKAQECLKSSKRASAKGDARRIDVVKDVIDATCVRWVCETILNIHFKDIGSVGIEDLKKSQSRETKERADFAYCYIYIFRNAESEFGWNARERALTASRHLSQHIQNRIRKYDQPAAKSWLSGLHFGLDQYFNGKMVLQRQPYTFIDRVLKARQLRPLQRLTAHGHLAEVREKALAKIIGDVAQISSAVSDLLEHERKIFNRLITYQNDFDVSDHGIKHKAWEDIEEIRVIANVIGLAVVISVHFSKACAQAVDFYLDDKYMKEREELVKLCKDDRSSNEAIMGYVWEALRIKQRFGLWRDVTPSGHTKEIEQGSGYPPVIIKPGDSVFMDFTYAHNDPLQVPEPEKVKLDRKLNSLLGLGVHKCPAKSFIEQTMSQMIRVIFKQEGLKRYGKEGKEGNLRSTTLHPHVEPWHSEVYLDEDGSFSYYPRKMVLQFDRSEPNVHWDYNFEEDYSTLDWCISNAWAILLIVLPLYLMHLVLYFLGPSWLSKLLSTSASSGLNFEPTVQDWNIGATCKVKSVIFTPPLEECPATAVIAEPMIASTSPRRRPLLEAGKITEPFSPDRSEVQPNVI